MEKYITSPEELCNTISSYGVAIVNNVLDHKEICNMRDGVWDYLEHISQNWSNSINRNDKTTWSYFQLLQPKHSMLMQHFGIGHAQYIWDIRQNPNVTNVFSKIWDVQPEELITSFDGASFHIPPESMGTKIKKSIGWFHTDQSYRRNDFLCIQSWITAYDVNEEDATLVILEGSHKYHKEFAPIANIKDNKDWYKLNNGEIEWYKSKGCKEVRIKCNAGDMVLWDSRTIHYGSEPLNIRTDPNFRNVAYICMMPRSMATKSRLDKKRKYFTEMRTTSHWANKSLVFPKKPWTRGAGPLPEITEINPPVLTDIGKKLAGF